MVLISLIISMIVILFLVSKKVNIGYSLMIGSVVLAILNKKSLFYIINTFYLTFTDYTTLSLALTIALISILGYLMDKYLILDRMIIALEKILRSAKATILISPAIIGTLLVTGGALMSCPVVDNLGNRLDIPKDKRASINLVFRHALYFIFPLSPALIQASIIGEFNVNDFIKLQFPIAISMYVAGYFFYLRGCHEDNIEKVDIKKYFKAIIEFSLYSSPILISLLGAVLLKLPFYISLLFGILLSIVINIYDKRKDDKYNVNESILKTLYKGIKPSMVIAILGIMVFKNVVNDTDELFIYLNSLLDKGIPVELIMILASGIISFSLASTQASIAILFPMILPLAGTYEIKLLYAMFIYSSAFIFYYISPLHMCQVLTLEYFNTKLKDLYKNYLFVIPSVYIVMLAIYFINKYI